jgi:uncharacterized protein (TIGR02271 family)
MNKTVVGIFDNPSDAPNAVQQLLIHGFTRAEIDVCINKSGQSDERVTNFFTSLFGKGESEPYSELARRSGAIITVHAGSENAARQAAEILDEAGAVDMDERASEYRTGEPDTARPIAETGTVAEPLREETELHGMPAVESCGETIAAQERPTAESSAGESAGENAIPIIEEQLKVGKKEVETGRIRLRSKIIEQPVEESLRLREEHVYVERHPADRPATQAELEGFQEGVIELTEHAEVPIVNKEARVVEEVKVGKEIGEREEVVREKLRKTHIDVEGGKRPQK